MSNLQKKFVKKKSQQLFQSKIYADIFIFRYEGNRELVVENGK